MSIRLLYHLGRADFLERVRGYSFLVVIVAAVFLGYETVVGNIGIHIGPYRGLYNSAWVGMLMSMMASIYISVPGFYIVKNAVDRDRQTRVGEILAATPVSRLAYVCGKFLSNLAVLGSIAAILIVAAVVMQWSRGEATALAPWPLLAPFLLITLPILACLAGLAVLFESVRWLAGGLGNVFYFLLWASLLQRSLSTNSPWVDTLGLAMSRASLGSAVQARFPEFEGGVSMGSGSGGYHSFEPFLWGGVEWTTEVVAARLLWVAFALACLAFAAVMFDRFDPARGGPAPRQRKARWLSALADPVARVCLQRIRPIPLVGLHPSNCFIALLLGELRLMLKGRHWWWYAGAAGLLLASLVLPLEDVQQTVLPLAWIWPILLWSAMGAREARYQTREIIFSSAHSLRRHLPATWLAGVLVATLTGSGAAFRLLLAGDLHALLAWAVGAAFIPSMALAFGILSGGCRLFEATYAGIWYAGPLKHMPSLDFLAPALDRSLIYLIITLALLGVALLGRRHQLQRQ
jgi:hypothetical protein